jgi:hypothetical protein
MIDSEIDEKMKDYFEIEVDTISNIDSFLRDIK